MCSFHIVLHEVLPLVSGEVHQVPQQECLYHDRHLRQKLLRLSQKCVLAAHEKYNQSRRAR